VSAEAGSSLQNSSVLYPQWRQIGFFFLSIWIQFSERTVTLRTMVFVMPAAIFPERAFAEKLLPKQ
jgi:hypothetical protein